MGGRNRNGETEFQFHDGMLNVHLVWVCFTMAISVVNERVNF